MLLIATLAAFAWLVLAAPGPAPAAPDVKKAIWGPGNAASFGHYENLGTGIYQYAIGWDWAAPTKRPDNPRNPADPDYKWPSELDAVIARAKQRGIKVSILLIYAPPWANGGKQRNDAPIDPQDFADFAKAASRRYPDAKYWQIWGEPTRRRNFRPMAKVNSGRQLTQSEKRGPRLYARILDAAYGAIKSVNASDLVIGGNTLTRGDTRPLRFIQALRLPSGEPPRMDLYGHNPFSPRKPDLSRGLIAPAAADFCDLDTLAGWIDSNLGRNPQGGRLRLFLAEYTLPSDHANYVFPWWGSRQDQADYLRAGLRITRSFGRVYTLGWNELFDQPPRPNGDEVNWGLLTHQGNRKPAYYTYKNR